VTDQSNIHAIYDMQTYLAAIVESSEDAIISKNLNGYITSWNQSAERIFGYKAAEAIGKSITMLIPPDRLHEEDRIIKSIQNGQRVPSFETKRLRKDGTIIDISVTVSPIRNQADAIIGASKVARDITSLKLSEKRLRDHEDLLLFAQEAGGIGVFIMDIATDILAITPEAGRIFGYPDKDRVAYTEVEALFYPGDAPPRPSPNADLNHSSSMHVEYRIIRAHDKAIRWISRKAKFIHDENGTPVNMIGIVQDITDRKIVEQNLEHSQKQLEQLLNAVPQHVWTATADGTIDSFNQYTWNYIGEAPENNHIVDWTRFIHPDDIPHTERLWAESIAQGTGFEIEQRVYHKETEQFRWNLTRALPVHDEYGAITKWVGTNTDIEDHKRIIEAAKSANIAKTDFLANMSHEIRTPMNAVIGLANILAMSEPLTDKQRHFIKTLQVSADSLLALINDLLDIAKIEARTIELETIPFYITHLMQEIASMLNVRIQEKGLTLTGNDKELMHRYYKGDPTRLRQIILNLCSNAVKFTDKGSVYITLRSEPSFKNNVEKVYISVKDTGIGIEQKNIETIFQKFMQADSSINRKYGGTGLGLAITKTLVDVMGGTIQVESEIGVGSTFTVCLPLEVAQNEDQTKTKAVPLFAQETYKKPEQTILIVEDYAPNILVASAFLDEFGYRHDVARNGMEAIEKIKNNDYAAALMDVQMHGMNGLEATHLIRQREKQYSGNRLPIIGMTAHAMAGDRERCLAAGMDDYITKPFDPDMLRQKLKTIIKDQ
jgi:PAS domain S-box-containing protein